MTAGRTAEEFFAGRPVGLAVLGRVRDALAGTEGLAERVTGSQVAFRRRRGFAYLWLPDRYLRPPVAEVVLTIALGRADTSPRFKQVAHPSPRHWVHHQEVGDAAQIDDEVAGWLREAAGRAG